MANFPRASSLNSGVPEELLVVGTTGEVTSAAQHQLLLYGSLEAIMALLYITILVRWELGKVPRRDRTDRMSTAVYNV